MKGNYQWREGGRWRCDTGNSNDEERKEMCLSGTCCGSVDVELKTWADKLNPNLFWLLHSVERWAHNMGLGFLFSD